MDTIVVAFPQETVSGETVHVNEGSLLKRESQSHSLWVVAVSTASPCSGKLFEKKNILNTHKTNK